MLFLVDEVNKVETKHWNIFFFLILFSVTWRKCILKKKTQDQSYIEFSKESYVD